jgi:hypothetical protein
VKKSAMDPDRVVKCACGLTMRQRDWSDHWRSCYKGSSVPVTDDDIATLLDWEERRKTAAAEHKAWLAKQQKKRAAPA